MDQLDFNSEQKNAIGADLEQAIFIEGPAGTGKTSAAIARLERTLQIVSGYKILIIVPQQSLGNPYREHLINQSAHSGSMPTLTTISGFSRNLVRLFWPLISTKAEFGSPHKPPVFLSLETAQYCMAKVVEPFLGKGYFQSITIEKNRLFSQIIDNLNKCAISGIPLKEIAARLKSISAVNPEIFSAFDQVQDCASKFRSYCLDHNLIDFSLLLTIFREHVWHLDICQQYIRARYEALFADNLEEDTPFTHTLIEDLSRMVSSSTFVYDTNGGFRSFLGANAESGYSLRINCREHFHFHKEFTTSEDMMGFRKALISCIRKEKDTLLDYTLPNKSELIIYRYYPEMISETCNRISGLIENGVQPHDIVVLSPYLSDSLKFSLSEKLYSLDIPSLSSRPSRMYIESPEIKSLISFAKLAHPQWGFTLTELEFRHFLMQFIPGMDIIRAELIVKSLYSKKENSCPIRSFDNLANINLQERISFQNGEKIEILRNWLIKYLEDGSVPLDIFLRNLYGQVLSVRGFSYHDNFNAANLIDRLIQSVQSFRIFSSEIFETDDHLSGKEYIKTVEQGLIPSSFKRRTRTENALLIAPAHTFLMENRSAAYQFWLDIGSMGWWERLYQPLTHPYVFKKNWAQGSVWDEQLEYETNQRVMERLIDGLLRRCSKGLFASAVKVNEYGSENYGPLLRAFQTHRKRMIQMKGKA